MNPELTDALDNGPFHIALRTAIEARGLGLDRIRHHLAARGVAVSTTSLSYWQSGKTRPEHPKSLSAIDTLEEILELPTGSLRSLLGPRRARGPRTLRADSDNPETVLGGADVRQLADQVPLVRENLADIITQQVVVHVNKHRQESLVELTMLVRARREDVDRYILLYRGDPGCNIEQVHLEAVRDCEIGKVVRHPKEPTMVAEVMFPGPLRQGDLQMFQVNISGTNTISDGHGHAFRHSVEQYVLQVRFDDEQLPARLYQFAQTQLSRQRKETGDMQLSANNTVELAATQLQPGALGVAWEWD